MTGHQPFRLPPAMGPAAYKTYAVSAPLATHWVPATCGEVDCPAYVNGFTTTVDETAELGQRQAHYIRHDRTRSFAESRQPSGMTRFTFPPGTPCFGGRHRRRLEREERFLITGGDYRGNPRGERPVELAPQAWTDDFGEHQDKLAEALERG